MEPEIEEKISARANAIWEQEGKPEGRHLEHWSRAKRLVAAEELRTAAAVLTTHPEMATRFLREQDE